MVEVLISAVVLVDSRFGVDMELVEELLEEIDSTVAYSLVTGTKVAESGRLV